MIQAVNTDRIIELAATILNASLAKKVFKYVSQEEEDFALSGVLALATKTEEEFLKFEIEYKEKKGYKYTYFYEKIYVFCEKDDRMLELRLEYIMNEIKNKYPFMEKYLNSKIKVITLDSNFSSYHVDKSKSLYLCYNLKKDDQLIDIKICNILKNHLRSTAVPYTLLFHPVFGFLHSQHLKNYINLAPPIFEVEETNDKNIRCSICNFTICKYFITDSNRDICKICAMVGGYNLSKVRKVQPSMVWKGSKDVQEIYTTWYDSKPIEIQKKVCIYDKIAIMGELSKENFLKTFIENLDILYKKKIVKMTLCEYF